MRSPKPRPDFSRFLRRLPLAVLAAAVVWAVARPAYNQLLAGSAQALARALEYPRAAQVTVDGDAALIGRADMRPGSGRLKVSLIATHFNLVPFLALTLALPGAFAAGGWRRGLLALAVLVLSHVLALLWEVKLFYATSLGPWSLANYSELARQGYGFLKYFFALPVTFTLPLLAWVAAFPNAVQRLARLDGAGPVTAPLDPPAKRASRQG